MGLEYNGLDVNIYFNEKVFNAVFTELINEL